MLDCCSAGITIPKQLESVAKISNLQCIDMLQYIEHSINWSASIYWSISIRSASIYWSTSFYWSTQYIEAYQYIANYLLLQRTLTVRCVLAYFRQKWKMYYSHNSKQGHPSLRAGGQGQWNSPLCHSIVQGK